MGMVVVEGRGVGGDDQLQRVVLSACCTVCYLCAGSGGGAARISALVVWHV